LSTSGIAAAEGDDKRIAAKAARRIAVFKSGDGAYQSDAAARQRSRQAEAL